MKQLAKHTQGDYTKCPPLDGAFHFSRTHSYDTWLTTAIMLLFLGVAVMVVSVSTITGSGLTQAKFKVYPSQSASGESLANITMRSKVECASVCHQHEGCTGCNYHRIR